MSDNVQPLSGDSRGNTKRIPSSKNWCFTFNNYKKYIKDGCLSSFSKLLESLGKYVFQEETGEQGTEHLQGYIKFDKPCRPSETLPYKTIHWEKSKGGELSNTKYCSKSDTRSGGFFTNIEGLEPEEKLEYDEPYGWQLEVLELIKTKPDKRQIHWYWEPKGQVGKTTLARYICAKNKNAIYIGGKSEDIKCAIMQMEKKPKIVILGIPKEVEQISYKALEEVKDGIFFSGKYESGMCLFNHPHVIVFSNRPPASGRLSADRIIEHRIEI
nr:MAG: replication associated protein [Cressdnaviricota sp.]